MSPAVFKMHNCIHAKRLYNVFTKTPSSAGKIAQTPLLEISENYIIKTYQSGNIQTSVLEISQSIFNFCLLTT